MTLVSVTLAAYYFYIVAKNSAEAVPLPRALSGIVAVSLLFALFAGQFGVFRADSLDEMHLHSALKEVVILLMLPILGVLAFMDRGRTSN